MVVKTHNTNRGRKLPIEVLNRDEIDALLRRCKASATGRRQAAIIILLYRSQLRSAEVSALKPADIDYSTGAITVLHGKGDKHRVVGIDQPSLSVIREWLRLRDPILRRAGLNPDDCPLICSHSRNPGQPVDTSQYRRFLPSMAAKAGIKKRVRPHALRATGLTELDRERVPLADIAQQAGHSNVATTSGYLARIAPAERVAIMAARQWTCPITAASTSLVCEPIGVG